MDSITVFQFNSQDIRFIKGKPVGIDVARALGYKDPTSAVRDLVKPKNKGVGKIPTIRYGENKSRMQEIVFLEEAGIYQLIFSSKLPSAEKFQDWVFEEVLPSIRKTGGYQRKSKLAANQSPEWLMIRQQGKDERRRLTDAIKDYIARHPELSKNKTKFLYLNASEALNLGVFGQRSKQLKALLGLSEHGALRDKLTSQENSTLAALEFLACRFIDFEDLDPCLAVKKAIESSYTNQVFAQKYLQYTLPEAK